MSENKKLVEPEHQQCPGAISFSEMPKSLIDYSPEKTYTLKNVNGSYTTYDHYILYGD